MTRPTETPPGEGSTRMALSEHANDANSGPVAGNRTPMTIALVVMAVLLVLVIAALISGIAALMD